MPISEVFNIDCMEYMRGIPDGFFDLAVVDPPYGIGITGTPGGNKKPIPFGGAQRSAALNHSATVGGGSLCRPKAITRLTTKSRLDRSISPSSSAWQRIKSFGAATIFSTISERRRA